MLYQRYGYSIKEIADYLKTHYTTVSKIVKKVEGRS
jgi:DNA-binding MarR family transcriptional regulator